MCSRKVLHESQFGSKRCFIKKITAVSKLTVLLSPPIEHLDSCKLCSEGRGFQG